MFSDNHIIILSLTDPANEKISEWESKIAGDVNDQKIAIISDQYYLDHFYNIFSIEFPNLYRSKRNDVIQPYFLPLGNQNSDELDQSFNEM